MRSDDDADDNFFWILLLNFLVSLVSCGSNYHAWKLHILCVIAHTNRSG